MSDQPEDAELTAEEWGSQADVVSQYARAVAAKVEAAFEARCFRLGRAWGPVCQYCDEPMVAILDRQTSGSAAFVGDGVATVEDWRVPVCAGHAARMVRLLAGRGERLAEG